MVVRYQDYFVYIQTSGNNRTTWFKVNNKVLFNSSWGTSYGSLDNFFILVKKG